jgi:hypothetical protein
MTEGPCIGPDCPECARYMREGWTCPIGTLTGEEVQAYLRKLHSGTYVPRGYWEGEQGYRRGVLLLRFAVTHILGAGTRKLLLEQFGAKAVARVSLNSWLEAHRPALFSAISESFPEYELYPWELGRVPNRYWKLPEAGLAALRWFLNRQGWSPRECLNELQIRSNWVGEELSRVRLSRLYVDLWIIDLLRHHDRSLDAKSVTTLRHEVLARKQAKRAKAATLECPWCHRWYQSLVLHLRHWRNTHPELNESDVCAFLNEIPTRETESLKLRRRDVARSRFKEELRLSKRRGVLIPHTYWADIRVAVAEMNEWSQSLELRPSNPKSSPDALRISVGRHGGALFVQLPHDLLNAIYTDTIVCPVGQKGVSLRFRTGEAQQAVWEWYQRRVSAKRHEA